MTRLKSQFKLKEPQSNAEEVYSIQIHLILYVLDLGPWKLDMVLNVKWETSSKWSMQCYELRSDDEDGKEVRVP